MSTPPPFTPEQLAWLQGNFSIKPPPSTSADLSSSSAGPTSVMGGASSEPASGLTSGTSTIVTSVLPKIPIFTPSISGNPGLELLAAATSKVSTGSDPLPPPTPPSAISTPGPFNPTAALPTKLVKRILDLEFVGMADITTDDVTPNDPGRPPAPARLPITNISQWVERFSLMAAIICTRFPHKAPELLVYQAVIIRAERNYEGTQWVSYDRRYRREALARKDLNWSVPDARLYNEAFTGRAKAIWRWSFCLQDDHDQNTCPQNSHWPFLGWLPQMGVWPMPVVPQPTVAQPMPSQEICRRFNEGRCVKQQCCKYIHSCSTCSGPHPQLQCPTRPPAGRSRSPQHRGPPTLPGQAANYFK